MEQPAKTPQPSFVLSLSHLQACRPTPISNGLQSQNTSFLYSCRRKRPVHRRQRFRAAMTPPPDDDPSAGEPSTQPESTVGGSADDTEESDLALPNLKELFAGAGRAGCEQCGGSGEIPCPVCEAKGFVTLSMLDTVSSAQCRLCRGQRAIPCPTCRRLVYKSITWWDQIPSKDEDPDEKWKDGPDGPRISWSEPPAGS